MRAPARVIWLIRLPAHSHIHTAVALAPEPDGSVGAGVTARVGISDERSYDQIAATMRCSPSVVRKRVSRGLAAMRAAIEEES